MALKNKGIPLNLLEKLDENCNRNSECFINKIEGLQIRAITMMNVSPCMIQWEKYI
jgi:hypothetical protein